MARIIVYEVRHIIAQTYKILFNLKLQDSNPELYNSTFQRILKWVQSLQKVLDVLIITAATLVSYYNKP